MYQALELRKVFGVFAIIVAASAVAVWLIRGPNGPVEWWETIGTAAALITAALLAIGESPLFRVVWRIPLIQKRFFPYIQGSYRGAISSNWGVIKASREHAAADAGIDPQQLDINTVGGFDKPVRVTIAASFLRLTMKIVPEDGYSDSQTIVMRPVLDGDEGYPCLYYLYKVVVTQPLPTDSGNNLGAARLNVIAKPGEPLQLVGIYWTNRNWSKAMNTAGRLKVSKTA